MRRLRGFHRLGTGHLHQLTNNIHSILAIPHEQIICAICVIRVICVLTESA